LSFGGKESDSVLGNEAAVWDAAPAEPKNWDAPPAPPSGIEKENESARYLRSYENRPTPSPFSSLRTLNSRLDREDASSTYSHSDYDDEASDISSSAMGSLRRRNRISKIHAEKLLIRKERENLEKDMKKKKPLSSKTSINEVKPKPSSALKSAPKNVSFGAKSEGSPSLSMESKVESVYPKTSAPTTLKDIESSSGSMVEQLPRGPLMATLSRNSLLEKYLDDPSNSSIITTSANSSSPDRSVATNWTYSTGGSGGGRVYRTRIICTGKYKGRVVDKVATVHPDDLQIGRRLEGLENGFVNQEDFAHTLITALFDADMKKEPLHKVKQWEMTNSTLSRLEKEQKPKGKPKEVDGLSDSATATTVSEETGDGEDHADIAPPPMKLPTPTISVSREEGDVQFAASRTASLQFKDVFGMASAKGIIHFYEGRDEIWIEDYNFCFASRRFKFLSG